MMLAGQDRILADDVVVVTGGTGLFGTAIREVVEASGCAGTWHYLGRRDCDLTDLAAVRAYFAEVKPTYVIHLAAYVGGLFRNSDPRERINFWIKNVNMNNNVLLCSSEFGVKKCLSCLSTCIFPDEVELPLTEQVLFNGPPHQSNAPYAYAKRMLGLFSQWLNRIENVSTKYLCVIPCNLYGKHDNFNIQEGHVLPGLMHKCLIAKRDSTPFVLWGTGRPLRQFLYVPDAARMLLMLFLNYDGPEDFVSITVGEEDEVSIRDAADAILRAFEFEGEFVSDTTKADGQFQKTTSNARFMSLFPDFKFTPFEQAIKETVDWFIANYETCRK